MQGHLRVEGSVEGHFQSGGVRPTENGARRHAHPHARGHPDRITHVFPTLVIALRCVISDIAVGWRRVEDWARDVYC